MFTRKFDRRVYIAVGTFAFACALGLTFGAYVLWPSNLEAGYEPTQPLAFSHKLHAGDLKIDCQYCHVRADNGAQATVPSVSICMNCHEQVQPTDEEGNLKPDIARLLDHWKSKEPIVWNKVNMVADFVYFDHSRHVNAGISCQECHGPVEEMEFMRRQHGLKMSWCLDCHKQDLPADHPGGEQGWTTRGPTHCTACHR